MSIYKDTKFINQIINLDGNSFEGCKFEGCHLVYSGESIVSFNKCYFINIEWEMKDAAARTADFLRAIYHGFGSEGRNIIENFLSEANSDQNQLHKINKSESGDTNE